MAAPTGPGPGIARQTAHKARIADILKGEYVKIEGWEPNYVVIGSRRVSRVNLMASVVAKEEDSIIIDDGSASIRARGFDGNLWMDDVAPGEIVTIIGRPREFGSERYLVPEIVRRIIDSEWVAVRTCELELIDTLDPRADASQVPRTQAAEQPEADSLSKDAHRVCSIIKELDASDGADTASVVAKANLPKAQQIIEMMLKEGEIFEVRPGRLKVLE